MGKRTLQFLLLIYIMLGSSLGACPIGNYQSQGGITSGNLLIKGDQRSIAPNTTVVKAFLQGDSLNLLIAQVTSKEGKVLRQYPQINLLLAEGSPFLLKELSNSGVNIYPDRIFHGCLSSSVPVIKPPAQWSLLESQFGHAINGTGTNVSVLDTGINRFHWDLTYQANSDTPKILAEVSFVTGHPSAMDDNGHGSHCASIIAGTGNRSSGLYTGVAPGASLLNCKVLDSSNSGQEDWIIDGIFWSVAHKAHVINLSLASLESGNGTDPLSRAVDWAVRQGVVVVIASGSSSGFYKVGKPGVANLGITVGATNDADGITTLGGFGPTLDFRLKPELCAPGQNIIAARAGITPDLTIGTPINDYYTEVSGTSQATAHVSAVVALLLQGHPTWTPAEVKAALFETAKPLGDDVYKRGAGRVDAVASTNSSLVVTPAILDLQVFGSITVHRKLLIRNFKSQPVSCQFTAGASIALSPGDCIIPALGTTSINLTYTPIGWGGYHQEQVVQMAYEGKRSHLLICHLAPNCTSKSSTAVIPYAGSFKVQANVTMDQYTQVNLVNLSLEVGAGPVLLATRPITTSVLTTYNFTSLHSTLLYRGSHALQVRLLQNGAVKGVMQMPLTVQGWSSTLQVAPMTGKQGSTLPLRWNLTDAHGLFIGIVNVSIQVESTWRWIGASSTSTLAFNLTLPPGTYSVRLEFVGDKIHESTIAYSTLQILLGEAPPSWWEAYRWWVILGGIGGIIALIVTVAIRRVRHRPPTLTSKQKMQQIRELVRGKAKAIREPIPEKGKKREVAVIATGHPMEERLTEAEQEQIDRQLRSLVKSAQNFRSAKDYEKAATAYHDAAKLAAQLGKFEMARVYAKKGEEMQSRGQGEG